MSAIKNLWKRRKVNFNPLTRGNGWADRRDRKDAEHVMHKEGLAGAARARDSSMTFEERFLASSHGALPEGMSLVYDPRRDGQIPKDYLLDFVPESAVSSTEQRPETPGMPYNVCSDCGLENPYRIRGNDVICRNCGIVASEDVTAYVLRGRMDIGAVTQSSPSEEELKAQLVERAYERGVKHPESTILLNYYTSTKPHLR